MVAAGGMGSHSSGRRGGDDFPDSIVSHVYPRGRVSLGYRGHGDDPERRLGHTPAARTGVSWAGSCWELADGPMLGLSWRGRYLGDSAAKCVWHMSGNYIC